MMTSEILAYAKQVRGRSGRPADAHRLRTQHLLEAGVHFFFLNELAPVGLGYTLSHGNTKPGIFLKQTQGCVHYQMLSVGP